jgi:hypothetical protein
MEKTVAFLLMCVEGYYDHCESVDFAGYVKSHFRGEIPFILALHYPSSME